jgi:hypothetical protein
MTRVITSLSMSVDGFITGPDPAREQPLGDGGHAALRLVRRRRHPQPLLRVVSDVARERLCSTRRLTGRRAVP